MDNGKPFRESRDADVPTVIRHLYHHAGWAQVMDREMRGFKPVGRETFQTRRYGNFSVWISLREVFCHYVCFIFSTISLLRNTLVPTTEILHPTPPLYHFKVCGNFHSLIVLHTLYFIFEIFL